MRARISERGPRPKLGPLALLALVLLAAGILRAVGEEWDAAQVPWEQIEAWALGKSEKNPFRPASEGEAKSVTPAAQPAAGDSKPVKSPAPADLPPPEAKPAYVAAPGKRRAEPPQCAEIRQKICREMEARLKEAEQYKKFREAWDACFKMEDYPRALGCLAFMLQDKRSQGDREDGWVSGRLWETGMLVAPRQPQERLDSFFADWRTKSLARFARLEDNDPVWARLNKDNEIRWFKKMEEFYAKDARDLQETLKDLDLKADADPAALWELCSRFLDSRPHAPIRCACALYKLREWFPDSAHTKSGEVQSRLLYLLAHELRLYKESAEEGQRLLESWPQNPTVTGGEGHWITAESLVRHGNALKGKLGVEHWIEAQKLYQEFQKRYPKHWGNQPKMPPDQPAGRSQCWVCLRDLEFKLRGR